MGQPTGQPCNKIFNSNLSSTIESAAQGGALKEVRAVDGARSEAGELQNPSWSTPPPLQAAKPAAGKAFHLVGTATSGDLGARGRPGRVEGSEGLAGLLPVPPSSQLPDNVVPLNSGGNLPESADQVFDKLPVRDPIWVSSINIPLEDGQVWDQSS